MARKFLYAVAALIFIFIIGAVLVAAFRDELTEWALTPGDDFAAYTPPPAPDYAEAAAWAARPDMQDFADNTPPGVPDNQAIADVDVFFVHPTTYLDQSSWNAPLDDETARGRIDAFVMRHQASPFNGCCRVYAPLYRQATVAAFLANNRENGKQALMLAYDDVRRAFRHYLEHDNQGRPFIVAGHSQGSWHLVNLLRDEIAGTPLADRMVAAYPVGYAVPEDFIASVLPGIDVCETPTQTGCLVTWNTYWDDGDISALGQALGFPYASGADADIPLMEGKRYVCVNPLTWRTDEDIAPAEDNLGATPIYPDDTGIKRLDTALTGAQCRDGVLYADLSTMDGYDLIALPDRNLHVYDYNLFYMNVRENAAARADAFMTGQPANP